jgi:hypothetical protein
MQYSPQLKEVKKALCGPAISIMLMSMRAYIARIRITRDIRAIKIRKLPIALITAHLRGGNDGYYKLSPKCVNVARSYMGYSILV